MLDDKTGSSVRSDSLGHYEIRLRGTLNQHWLEWFNGSAVRIERSEGVPPLTTILVRELDQAKLRGILNKLWDLNLKLVSVRELCDPTAGQEQSVRYE